VVGVASSNLAAPTNLKIIVGVLSRKRSNTQITNAAYKSKSDAPLSKPNSSGEICEPAYPSSFWMQFSPNIATVKFVWWRAEIWKLI
jgi:hypothetical protein